MSKKHHPDATLIQALGGPTRLAQKLGYQSNGTQTVHNWTKRGIPARVKLDRPDIFLKISHASS